MWLLLWSKPEDLFGRWRPNRFQTVSALIWRNELGPYQYPFCPPFAPQIEVCSISALWYCNASQCLAFSKEAPPLWDSHFDFVALIHHLATRMRYSKSFFDEGFSSSYERAPQNNCWWLLLAPSSELPLFGASWWMQPHAERLESFQRTHCFHTYSDSTHLFKAFSSESTAKNAAVKRERGSLQDRESCHSFQRPSQSFSDRRCLDSRRGPQGSERKQRPSPHRVYL